MSIKKKLVLMSAPIALLAIGGCATGFPAQVSRFQAMPAPQGQSFIIEAADAENRGGLEFSRYADLVRRHLERQGFREASSRSDATLVVSLDYGVDNGRERVVARPDPFGYGFGFGRPYFSRFGYWGYRRSPFYWGWHDPFWGFGSDRLDSYTVYRSFVDMDIRRAADGQAVFEGLAEAQSRTNQLQVLVPNLVEAMFTGFPGNSGERVRITVSDDRPRG
ncbi:MAG: hypothetical protein JWL74_1777 [Alphaproteobacteria bacterium]|nr:hypothetical protein [Alphaproteobacteria bacterium]